MFGTYSSNQSRGSSGRKNGYRRGAVLYRGNRVSSGSGFFPSCGQGDNFPVGNTHSDVHSDFDFMQSPDFTPNYPSGDCEPRGSTTADVKLSGAGPRRGRYSWRRGRSGRRPGTRAGISGGTLPGRPTNVFENECTLVHVSSDVPESQDVDPKSKVEDETYCAKGFAKSSELTYERESAHESEKCHVQEVEIDIEDISEENIKEDVSRILLVYRQAAAADAKLVRVSQEESLEQPPWKYALYIVINPTDPDFDRNSLLPHGLHFRLIYSIAKQKFIESPDGEKATESSELDINRNAARSSEKRPIPKGEGGRLVRPPTARPAVRPKARRSPVSVTGEVVEAGFPDTLKFLLDKTFAAAAEKTKSGYAALAALNAAVRPAFDLCREHEYNEYLAWVRLWGLPPWTAQEDKRLKDAMVWYQNVVDSNIRWKKIAEFVNTGRSATECAQRFGDLIESANALTGDGAEKTTDAPIRGGEFKSPPESANNDIEVKSSAVEDSAVDKAKPNHTMNASIQELNFSDLNIEGISLVILIQCRLLLQCSRCKTESESPFKLRLPRTETDSNENGGALVIAEPAAPTTIPTTCEKCNWQGKCLVHCKVVFPGSSAFGTAVMSNLLLLDLLQCDYAVECASCSTSVVLRQLVPGKRRSAVCPRCFAKLYLQYEALQLGHTKTVMNAASTRNFPRRSPQSRDSHPLKLGTPLPNNGACVHYKKSYRWLRFPCGRAFPCDICHDENSDHQCEWATKMICGFCSKEQAYSQKPCACGHSVVARGTSHWEGGKGCRDPTRMDRKDSKKHKLLRRIQNKAAATSK